MANPVVRWQMISPDPARTAAFYESAFGWNVRTNNAMGYREVTSSASGRGIDGGIWPAPTNQPGFVQLFVEVTDIDAVIRQATSLGATVVVPKSVLPDGDAMAILLDPLGMTVGVCTLASVPPRQQAQ